MKERPILFSGPMVRALLDDTKTQTRRALKQEPIYDGRFAGGWKLLAKDGCETSICSPLVAAHCPYGEPGDRLWVRETWGFTARVSTDLHDRFMKEQDRDFLIHRASSGDEQASPWKPSIHMPRWACRLVLEITSVRVERLQDISRGDAMAEGCPFPNMAKGDDPREWFQGLWAQINGPESWAANPWVWVIEFKRIKP